MGSGAGSAGAAQPEREAAGYEQRQADAPACASHAKVLGHAQPDQRADDADQQIGQGKRAAARQPAGEIGGDQTRKYDDDRTDNDLLNSYSNFISVYVTF
jgi:hypothetical protein